MYKLLSIFSLLIIASSNIALAQEKLAALIIDGQNNHKAWPKTTMMMKDYLDASGRFTVDIERTKVTWQGKELVKQYPLEDGKAYEDLPKSKVDPDFAPEFSKYDVVISNFGWNAAAWPEKTQAAFEEFVSSGGGLAVIHAADNSFPEWEAYNKMIGIGGWGGRNEKSGPYVYFDKNDKEVRDTSPGKGGSHGPQHEFTIVVRDSEHPITKGLPHNWMHSADELYQQLRGPAGNMTILATAYASPDYRGLDRHEPMVMTIDYGKGRVFHTPMGHS
ncbi:MAG: ThuA domain-containing protein, partial [Planctomycetota bacterium]